MRNLIAVFVLMASSMFAADLTGQWVFQVETDAGSGSPTFVLKQDGQKLSGSYSGALGNADVAGTVRDTKFTITFEASGAKVVYEGTVESDGTVKGNVDLGGQAQGTFTGSRKK